MQINFIAVLVDVSAETTFSIAPDISLIKYLSYTFIINFSLS